VDVVVTGVPRGNAFGLLPSGATINSLARKSNTPILVVRNKPRFEYRTVVVTSDFSESSQPTLHAALRLFPNSTVLLFHAFRVPGRGLLNDDHAIWQFGQSIEQQARSFLLECSMTTDFDEARVKVVIEHGQMEWLLRDYVRAENVDLVVSGTVRQPAIMDLLIGSAAKRLLETIPSDLMIVPQPRRNVS